MLKLSKSVDSSTYIFSVTEIKRDSQKHQAAITKTMLPPKAHTLIMLMKTNKGVIA